MGQYTGIHISGQPDHESYVETIAERGQTETKNERQKTTIQK
jgi:hypothetical protein